MKKYYALPEACIIFEFLGGEETVEAVLRDRKTYCKVKVKSIDSAKAKVHVRFHDYDGSQFLFLIDVRNRLICFEEVQCMYGFDEKLLLTHVWRKIVEMMNIT